MLPKYDDTSFDLVKATQQFRLSLSKHTKETAESFAKKAKGEVSIWGKTVYTLLSKKVPASIYNSKTNPVTNRWVRRADDNPTPHLNSGALRDTLKYFVSTRTTGANNVSIFISASVGITKDGEELPQAFATNLGYKQRKDGSTPSWMGWHDNIMRPFREGIREFNVASDLVTTIKGSNMGITRIKSMHDVMKDLMNIRDNLEKRK